ANNFWGKDDAGVGPLLERMQAAKQTCDELRSFYSARASLEDEYARKLLSLCRKPLGSQEMGSLRISLDTVRGEVEAMGRQHQSIAAQLKTELEEPLAAFAGAMKERRKIVQNGIEKLLKTKIQQTQHVNKTRDRYEQECLKIKGYLAQGHMVMGQEERKNKAKLEKTQISVATTNTEYENAVKVLEDTTVRWNREWKAAADKFQDLEEERLDFTKSSLWQFANIASTVCVSDDASCEKIRLSLETMDVESDIATFIAEKGTGQEIPDPPKYINFCRGDVADSQSEASEDDNYSVAQFPRSINPAFRSSSPQPSTYESHHDPNSRLARDLAHREAQQSSQEPRPINPAFRSASPQPSTYESHHDPNSSLARELGHREAQQPSQEPRSINPAFTSSSPQHQHEANPTPRIMPQPTVSQHEAQHTNREAAVAPRIMPQPAAVSQAEVQQQSSRENAVAPRIMTQPAVSQGETQQQSNREDTAPRMMPQPAADHREAKQSSHEASLTPRLRPQTATSQREAQQPSRDASLTPRKMPQPEVGQRQNHADIPQHLTQRKQTQPQIPTIPPASSLAQVPHDPYPLDGMTMLCRTGPPSERSSQTPSARPSSRDSHSDYSNPTSMSSQELSSGKVSPVKQDRQEQPVEAVPEKQVLKKKSGFFQNRSPFRRKSFKSSNDSVSNRNTWHSSPATAQSTPARRPQLYSQQASSSTPSRATPSPEPIEANATLALNVGQNVFPVSNPDTERKQEASSSEEAEETDPIALALAELKGLDPGKQAAGRVSADRYHGIATPAPSVANEQVARPVAPALGSNSAAGAGMRGTPPPLYDSKVQRLGVPPQAVTAKAMKETSRKFADQTRSIFGSGNPGGSTGGSVARPGTSASRPGTRGSDLPRAASPATTRSVSPRPAPRADTRSGHRSASPNPQARSSQRSPRVSHERPSRQSFVRQSPANDMPRGVSPAPYSEYGRLDGGVSAADMAIQLTPVGDDLYGSQRGRGSRPGTSMSNRGAMGLYDGGIPAQTGSRQRSKSVADPSRQYTSDGRPILHFARALYMYQAAIPEELGFAKGDTLAVLRHQDDGWWEAEVHGANGRIGLVPSNYLQPWDLTGGTKELDEMEMAEIQTIRKMYRVATSKGTHRILIYISLLFAASIPLLLLATIATLSFYHNYLPDQVFSAPVYLQYGVGPHPFGVASLAEANLKTHQAYDIAVVLSVPQSPTNTDRGNFMVNLHLLGPGFPSADSESYDAPEPESLLHQRKKLFSSRRPALLPYRDPLVSLASRILLLGYHLLVPESQALDLKVSMGEQVELASQYSDMPVSAYLEIHAGQVLQTYDATIVITAQLRGLRWLMYQYRIPVFILATLLFWAAEIFFMVAVWAIWT
ncbi:hypothetical protein ACRALDRAFT_1007124, partial [Sodiomyces alcalophilus JCM 7366]|uniref:uncharacterized protein n=1 Tax=Sodiomyces alcalophilus JCM 7366 TaxID=591952 RepID=UPI0039B432BA